MSTYPILALYKINEILTMGDISLLILIILTFFSGKIVIEKKIIYLVIVLSLLNYINGLISGDMTSVLNNSLGILKFGIVLAILFYSKIFNFDIFYKYCLGISLISIIFLLYQVLIYNLQGEITTGKILGFELIENVLKSENWGRFSSFFAEPAHMSIYIAPVLAISLIDGKYLISLIMLFGILLTTSSSGIIFIAIIIIYRYLNMKEIYDYKKILSVIILFIFFYFGYELITTYYYNNYVSKLTLDYFINNIRLFGGIEYLKYLNINEWIVGIGINKLATFGETHYFVASNYSNSFIFGIISFGLVGSFFLYRWIWLIKKGLDYKYNILFIILISILFSDQVLFNWNLLYMLMWLGICSKNILKKI